MKVFLFNAKRVLASLVLMTVIASTACAPSSSPIAAPTGTRLPTETTSPTIQATATATITPTATAKPTLEPPATATPTTTTDPTKGRFEGAIYFSGEPFVGATVSLGDPTKDAKDPEYRVAEVTTDAQGSYSFVVDPGEYTLGVVLVFSESDYLCPAQSGGIPMVWIPSVPTSETDPTKMVDRWFGVWGTRSDGAKILIASSDSKTVAAGDVVQRDMFAGCNQ